MVLVGIVVALLLACGALALFLLPKSQKTPDAAAVLAPIDRAIAGGYLSTAEEALRSLRTLPQGEHDLLAILKRAFDVCSATGDYGVLADLGAKALARQGRSASIRTVAAYGALRAGRVAEAQKILARGALDGGAGDGLRAELALRSGGPGAGLDSLARELLALEGSRDASLYEKAALRTGDHRLHLDAALLQMEAASPARAQLIAQAELVDAAYDEPAANISYDSGDFPAAVTKLLRLDASRPGRAEVGFLLADAYQGQGMLAETERSLVRSIALGPRLSWTPYFDLAFLALQRSDTGLAGRRLAEGLAFFPGSVDLARAQAALLQKTGDTAKAVSVLSKLAEEHPENAAVVLQLLQLQAPGISPEQYRARLWKLYNRVPADATVFGALCTALIAAHDWEGAGEAVRQYGDAGGGGQSTGGGSGGGAQLTVGAVDKDLLLLQGMVAEMRGDTKGALEAFSRSEALGRDGVVAATWRSCCCAAATRCGLPRSLQRRQTRTRGAARKGG
jgi:hypothetical protein